MAKTTQQQRQEDERALEQMMNRIMTLWGQREAIDKELKEMGLDPRAGTIQISDADVGF